MTPSTLSSAAIVGIGRTSFVRKSGRTPLAMASEAARDALRDCGLAAGDVDGFTCYGTGDSASPMQVAHAIGIDDLGWCTSVMGCGVTSIYWYFRSKDDLVVALVERVTRDALTMLPPVGNGAWDDELVAYFTAFRSLMHRTPLYREVFARRGRLTFEANRLGRQVLRRTDTGLELLTRAGFTPQDAAVIHTIFSNYAMGFIMREYGAADEDQEDVAAVNASIVRLGADELPTLVQVEDYGSIRAFDDEQFLAGLRLLLQGVRQELQSPELTSGSAKRPRSAKAGSP